MRRRAAMTRFCSDESGATAIEYGLIVGIMSVVVISIAATGGALDSIYARISLIIAAIT